MADRLPAAEVTVFVCSCFGITEQQVREHAAAGACTPRDIASRSKAGTDCGSCVRRIQGLLGRGDCSRRETLRRRIEGTEATAPAPSVPGVPAPALPLPAAAVAAAFSSPSVTGAAPARLESAVV